MATSRKAKRPKAQAPGRVKKSIHLPAELARRLEVYAAATGEDQSDVVARALEPVLAGFGWFTRSAPGSTARSEAPQPRLAGASGDSQAAA